MIELGRAALALALLTALYAAGAALVGRTRRSPLGRLLAPRRLCALRTADPLRGGAGGGVPAQRLLIPARRRPLLDHDAVLLPADLDVVEPGRLAAALGLGAFDRLQRRSLRDPRQIARAGALRDRGADGGWRLLRRAGPFRVQSLRASEPGAGRGLGAEPAAAPPEHAHAPADALLGLRLLHGAVCVRGWGPDHPPPRRRLDPRHSPLRADRLDLPLDRDRPRRAAGPTPSWAGAATGPGTRSRTRR